MTEVTKIPAWGALENVLKELRAFIPQIKNCVQIWFPQTPNSLLPAAPPPFLRGRRRGDTKFPTD